MTKVKVHASISLDGYMAGPNQTEDDPIGEGGMALHEWMFKVRAWRDAHGEEGGEESPSSKVVDEMLENDGAGIMGRNMFGPIRGDWGDEAWNGWWGDEPPYHTPVYVLTHHAREPVEMEGGTTFYFVTDGIESAFEQAKEAAGDKNISIHGGASAIQQYLAAGYVDEIDFNVAPILLGSGERPLDNLGDKLPELTLERTIGTPEVTHLKYSVKN
jgi:dihydrofolate reductase